MKCLKCDKQASENSNYCPECFPGIKIKRSTVLCKIFGHKWREFEVTETKLVPEKRWVGTGFAMIEERYTGMMVEEDYGYNKELKACRRCGEPNPNY